MFAFQKYIVTLWIHTINSSN